MKKKYGLFIGFILIVIAIISYCVFYVFGNVTGESYTFNKDGYALYVNKNNNYKAESYSFTNGSTYSYKKSNNKIVFNSTDNGNVSVDETTVVHYTDGSLLTLKNVVGLDLNTIDNAIILYYNIYKNTNILYDNGGYSINSSIGEKIKFSNILLRVSDNKYLFVSDSIRATIGNDEVVDFGKYAYIEYTDGSVVAIYNNTKSHQTIADDLSIVSGDITINIGDKTIAKKGEKYITLSNLVIDSSANIDLIPQEEGKLPNINKPNVDTNISGGEGSDVENNGSVGTPDNNVNDEVIEDENKVVKQPVYKVVNMAVTPIKIDAELEIIDEDSLITTPTDISIVNNATLEIVYESNVPAGDTSAFISTANLEPDTEYTIYAKAAYTIEEVEYSKSFVNKIFRTKAIGVSFKKSYATSDSLVIEVNKEGYSDVTSLVVSLYTKDGGRITYTGVDFTENNKVEIVFDQLENNTEYSVVMHDILCDGVSVEDGYSEEKSMFTLKESPVVSDLTYQINKRTSTFDLSIGKVVDPDYGIKGYRYEIFRVDQDMNKELPLLTFDTNNLKPISVNVDENNLNRGATYTYRVIIIFDDNEKTIEYVKDLGSTMQLDGVEYPKIRFEKTYVTWEQINGTIIIDDEFDTIVGDDYRVVYKNSADVFKTNTIVASTSEDVIPIGINNLRANESYTFQVYADINLKDGNPTIDEAYIGSVVVQTGLPQQIQASYSTNLDYSTPFSINLRLSDLVGQDAKLEASTISEMTVTLYQGNNAGGAIEIAKKVIDTYDEAYESTIKETFYDTQGVINPAFFGASNSDFTQKAYTLKISNVYDYTDYKNEITIVNDTFAFNTNSYVPDVPTSDATAINVTTILNKNAEVFGLEPDPNLLPDTIIGYSLVSNFPNDALNAMNLIYHVWVYNPDTKEFQILPELDKKLPYDEDGNVSSAIYQVGYGTDKTVFDTDMLRRGNKYYFSYEVELDLDGDGVKEDVNYPAIHGDDIILKSDNLTPLKETPVHKMYPSVTSGRTATWKYMIKDIDKAYETNHLYSAIANNDPSSPKEIVLNDTKYNSVTFTNLEINNFYRLYSLVRRNKTELAQYSALPQQYLYPINSSLGLNYTSYVDANNLSLRITGYDNDATKILVDSIASVDITLKPVSGNVEAVTISNVVLDAGVAYVNLINYPQLMGIDLNVTMKAYFDSGNTGFDVPSNYKAVRVMDVIKETNYYNIINNEFLQTGNSVVGSEFTGTFDPEALLISITNKESSSVNVNIEIDERGVRYTGNSISFKEIKEENLTYDGDPINFNLLVPSISVVDKNTGKTSITSLLTSAIFNVKLTMIENVHLQDNLIYLDLFETDSEGNNPIPVNRVIKYTPENMGSSFTINELNPQTHYMVKFYTYICESANHNCNKYYLYDEDDKILEKEYKFHTLSNVGIDNINADFVVESYEKKSIRVTYTLENTIGFDYIEYKLYELVSGEYVPVDVNIEKALLFNKDMGFSIDAPPGNEQGFSYGKTYKLDIIPRGSYEVDDEEIEIDLGIKSHLFTLESYSDPQVSITGSKTDDNIFFRVNIKDTSKVINGSSYSIKLKEVGVEEPIAVLPDAVISSSTAKYTFDAEKYNLEQNHSYMIVIEFKADYNNSGKDLKIVQKTKTVHFGASVSLGAVTATKNDSDPYAIDMIFADSYLLDSVDTVAYTVTSTTTDYFSARENPFTLKFNSDTDIYTHTLRVDQNANFKAGNVYTITMNFFTGSKLVGSEEVSYYYAVSVGGGQ